LSALTFFILLLFLDFNTTLEKIYTYDKDKLVSVSITQLTGTNIVTYQGWVRNNRPHLFTLKIVNSRRIL